MTRQRPTIEQLEQGIRAGDRTTLAQAITLVESTRPADQAPAWSTSSWS
jgi:LAO/AO transport system kinase